MIYKPVILPVASNDIRDNARRYNTKQKGSRYWDAVF